LWRGRVARPEGTRASDRPGEEALGVGSLFGFSRRELDGGRGERKARMQNWAGNITFTATRRHAPASLEELQELLAREERVHAVGAGHSFSPVADGPGVLVDIGRLPGELSVDPVSGEATVPAGWTLEECCRRLDQDGRALAALPSLLGVTVAGAIATATHGSGDRAGNLASMVSGLEVVGPDGEVRWVDVPVPGETPGPASPPDDGLGLVVSLGVLGIVTRVRLRTVPAYDVVQTVYEDVDLGWVADTIGEILSSADSVSVFTRWSPNEPTRIWRKSRADVRDRDLPVGVDWQATRADGPRHPIPGLPADRCTEQGGVPGPWYARLPHFRPEATPSVGEELQSEYTVPRDQASRAARALMDLAARAESPLAHVVAISEVRSVAADALWLSPTFGRAGIAFHFTWYNDRVRVDRAIDAVEEVLVPLGARPHWGKLFHLDPSTLQDAFPRWAEFTRLRQRIDPTGVFLNRFTETYLGG